MAIYSPTLTGGEGCGRGKTVPSQVGLNRHLVVDPWGKHHKYDMETTLTPNIPSLGLGWSDLLSQPLGTKWSRGMENMDD